MMGVSMAADRTEPHAVSLDPETLFFALEMQRDPAPVPERRGVSRRRTQ